MIKITTKEVKDKELDTEFFKEMFKDESLTESERLGYALTYSICKAQIKVMNLNELEHYVKITEWLT